MKTSQLRTHKTVHNLSRYVPVFWAIPIIDRYIYLPRSDSAPSPNIGIWFWIFFVLSYLVVGFGSYFVARYVHESKNGIKSNRDGGEDNADKRQLEQEKMFQRYRLLSENTRDIILVIRVSDGKIMEANRAAIQAYGYELNELLTRHIIELRAPETRYLVEQQLEQAKASGIFFETTHQRKDGSLFPVEINSVSVDLDNERVLLSIIRNISERKRIEERLQESEEIFNQFLEHSPIYVFFKDKNIRSIRLSRNYEGMLGRPLNELLGKDMNDLFPSDLARNMIADDMRILEEGREIIAEEELNGRFYTTIKFPIRVAGKPRYLAGYTMDITDRKQAEMALAASTQRLQTTLAGAPIIIYSFDRDGIFTLSEGKGLSAMGLVPGEVVGQSVFDVYRDRPDILENMHRALAVEAFNASITMGDHTFEVFHSPLLDEQGAYGGTVGVIVDITRQRKAEEAIGKRALELATVAEISTAASTVLDTGILLQKVVDLTRERFSLYHAHIYMLDDAGNTLILAAGAGEIGRRMVSNRHSISITHEHSVVARAARTRLSVMINDVSQSPDFLPNLLLPETRSEMSIPLIFGDRVLGVLDVQSDQINHFSDDDINIHTTLAAQIANAVQNAQQYQKILTTASRLAGIQNAINEGAIVLITDTYGKIEFANENMVLISGYSHDELIGLDLRKLDSGQHREEYIRDIWKTVSQGKVWRGELYNCSRNGVYWVDATVSPILNENGESIKYIFVGFNITNRKQAEMALVEKSEELDRFFSSALDLLCIADADGHFLRLNTEWERSLGYSVSELVGRKFLDFVHPEDQSVTLDLMSNLKRGGDVLSFINRYICKDGSYRWIEWRSFSSGTLIYAAARDITERKQIEDKLRINEERLQQAIRVADIGIFDHDHVTDAIYWSPDLRNSYGIGLDDPFTLQDFLRQIHPDDIEKIAQAVERAHDPAGDGMFDVEYRFIRQDGMVRWFAAKSQTFFDGNDKTSRPVRTIGALIDITERKQMDEAFRESRNLLRTVLDTVPIRIFWKGMNLKYLGCNRAFAMDIGAKSPDEIIGKDDYQINGRDLADLYRSDDHQVLEVGLPKFSYKEPMVMANGSSIWVRTSKVPLRSADGAIHGVLGTYEDITESKRIEEERESLIDELESKNAELERFTYTVSHDLKSPLVTIKGFLGLLKQDVASGNMERFNSDLERIGNAAKKMEQLLRDLLELSRIGRVVNPMETIPFEDLAREAMEIVHGQIESRGITVHIQPNLPAVYGDRQRLTEVLQNLLDNAAKYMGDQKKPCIEIGVRNSEDNKSIFFVHDNGIGISPEHHERIFGLFNKLDVLSDGTGVGLALVKRIIEFHGGNIWVESESGRGATFFFTLPGNEIRSEKTI